MKRKKSIAVDLDGTLLSYDGWKGEGHYGAPNTGMCELLQRLHEAGWEIVIWTTRSSTAAISNHLQRYGITYDYINRNPNGPSSKSPKIYADVYLDDRAVRFEGKTDGLFEQIMDKATPWFEKED